MSGSFPCGTHEYPSRAGRPAWEKSEQKRSQRRGSVARSCRKERSGTLDAHVSCTHWTTQNVAIDVSLSGKKHRRQPIMVEIVICGGKVMDDCIDRLLGSTLFVHYGVIADRAARPIRGSGNSSDLIDGAISRSDPPRREVAGDGQSAQFDRRTDGLAA